MDTRCAIRRFGGFRRSASGKMKNLENSLSSIKNERSLNGISLKNINKLICSPDPEKRKKVALWLAQKKDFDESSHLILKRLIKDEDRSVWTAASP